MTAELTGRRRRATRRADTTLGPIAGDRDVRVRLEVRLVGGEAGRALAAAQGKALSALLATLGEVEVEGCEGVSP
jgi:hypothetical protein